MKLVIFEDASYDQFYPLTYMRPAFDLRCGSTLLREKVERAFGRKADVVFVREWLREAYAVRTSAKVNDLGALAGRRPHPRQRARPVDRRQVPGRRPRRVRDGRRGRRLCDPDETDRREGPRDPTSPASSPLRPRPSPPSKTDLKLLGYPWHLIEENGAAIRDDFKKIGKSGVHGTLGPTRRHLGAAGPGLCRPRRGHRALRRH